MKTQETIITIISEMVKVDPETIMLSTKISDIAHDSIQLFELFIRFEQEMGGKLSYEEVAHIETVGDVVAFVEKRQTYNTFSLAEEVPALSQ